MLVSANTREDQNTCSRNICEVLSLLKNESYLSHEFQTNLEIFANVSILESGHTALKRVLEDMGKRIQVEQDHPLQTYVIKHQKLLHEEIQRKINQVLEDETLYIAGALRDMEKHQVKTSALFSERLNQNINEVQINLFKKLDNIEMGLANKMDDQIHNITLLFFDGLAQKCNTFEVIRTVLMIQAKNKLIDVEVKLNECKPSDCFDILNAGETKSGVYTIFIEGLNTKGTSVYCNMDTDGGGWTVFVKRQKQATTENFNRNWNEYKNGFGNPAAEYWLGNEALHIMTTSKAYIMRTDAVGPGSPSNVWGEYSQFQVESENDKYRLVISGANAAGTITNNPDFGLPNTGGFLYNNGQYFSTVDMDNDKTSSQNCAELYGGFWHDSCTYHGPTAVHGKIGFLPWSTTDKVGNYATDVEMKLRPKSLNGK